MVLKIKKYWFSVLLAVLFLVPALVLVIVAVAPHNDVKMRGFTPCTYNMAADLNVVGAERDMFGTVKSVGKGYVCYAMVIANGVSLWLKGVQKTIWANYMFEPEIDKDLALFEESEPFSEDLLKANLLDKEDEAEEIAVNDNVKENADE